MSGTEPEHPCHTLKVSNSQPLTAPSASHPTFGVASGGQDGARRAEEVREITGKTFHLLLRCLPTGGERCVAGSTSALPPRQPARERNQGGAGGERGSLSAAQGAMTASLFSQADSAGRQAADSGENCASPGEQTAHGVSAPPLPCRQFTPCM